jgi:hypothetical protein
MACIAVAAPVTAAESLYTFDASEFEKKPFELGGYVELKGDHFRLNEDGAFYALSPAGRARRQTLERGTATLELAGKARAGDWLLSARSRSEYAYDQLTEDQRHRFDELYATWKPSSSFTLEAGKTVIKWGKGYAWNPVGFVERPKDPNDPELAREGFTVLAADIVRSFEGEGLQALAFTPLLLPVRSDVNQDFGPSHHVNVAAKLYLLYRNTDIDLYALGEGTRSRRIGMDFSRNVLANLEVHGEWARIEGQEFAIVGPSGTVTRRRETVHSWLLGLRYLSQRDTTYIAELYRNGAGFSPSEFRRFIDVVDRAARTGNPNLFARAQSLASAYGRQSPMRNYFYLRVSQKEPFDILYFTPALTAIVNLSDRSYSIAPELLYSGRGNVEIRARAVFLQGRSGTDFGERLSTRRVEVRARLYF